MTGIVCACCGHFYPVGIVATRIVKYVYSGRAASGIRIIVRVALSKIVYIAQCSTAGIHHRYIKEYPRCGGVYLYGLSHLQLAAGRRSFPYTYQVRAGSCIGKIGSGQTATCIPAGTRRLIVFEVSLAVCAIDLDTPSFIRISR